MRMDIRLSQARCMNHNSLLADNKSFQNVSLAGLTPVTKHHASSDPRIAANPGWLHRLQYWLHKSTCSSQLERYWWNSRQASIQSQPLNIVYVVTKRRKWINIMHHFKHVIVFMFCCQKDPNVSLEWTLQFQGARWGLRIPKVASRLQRFKPLASRKNKGTIANIKMLAATKRQRQWLVLSTKIVKTCFKQIFKTGKRVFLAEQRLLALIPN